MFFMRRRHSDKQMGDLYCQTPLRNGKVCLSTNLKFIESNGPIDTYQCRKCGGLLRYHTVPCEHGISASDSRTLFDGLHSKEKSLLTRVSQKRTASRKKIFRIPGVGTFRATRTI